MVQVCLEWTGRHAIQTCTRPQLAVDNRESRSVGFAKSLADELAPHNVTVNAVCPGDMQTERVDDLVRERALRESRSESEIMTELVERIPMRRMREPSELAHAVAFLSSEQAEYITGVAMHVDGGYIRSVL